MERYVLLLKSPKGYNINPIKEEIEKLIQSKYPEVKAELHRCISLTVDLVILHKDGIVLIKRRNEPYKGYWALPGGFVEYGERVEDAAIREAKEETGLDVELLDLIGVYSDPKRDPRGHTVTIAFLAKGKGTLKGGDDASEARVFKLDEVKDLKLAFDHGKIIEDAFRVFR
ncbi:NUDIX hydrolase [Thermococcus litoralis DSM 5473]|uniref:NUDIX hydrolase n=1 Tax=Thermococcus litoralis (strain ATCC 51850 / DSM 5473 / JCM 8560 / NS-C) TaxID=523849 RepID=H3ZPB4_THELN|nr:NUDIX hydrolase [Thermococcus litoralis]EHR78149.1 NUDIX hydrolase [Thermococcus litoralis DSM 5473]